MWANTVYCKGFGIVYGSFTIQLVGQTYNITCILRGSRDRDGHKAPEGVIINSIPHKINRNQRWYQVFIKGCQSDVVWFCINTSSTKWKSQDSICHLNQFGIFKVDRSVDCILLIVINNSNPIDIQYVVAIGEIGVTHTYVCIIGPIWHFHQPVTKWKIGRRSVSYDVKCTGQRVSTPVPTINPSIFGSNSSWKNPTKSKVALRSGLQSIRQTYVIQIALGRNFDIIWILKIELVHIYNFVGNSEIYSCNGIRIVRRWSGYCGWIVTNT